jgi:hypothetical protein
MDFCELGSVRDMIETTNKVLNEDQIKVRHRRRRRPPNHAMLSCESHARG